MISKEFQLTIEFHEIFGNRLEKVEQFENISLPPGTIILRDNQDNILSVLGYINFDSEKNSKDGTVCLETIFYDMEHYLSAGL